MEAFINERKLKVNREIGRWLSLAGLAVLIVGMIVSIRKPELIWVSLLSLAIGFLSSTIGAYYANRWLRKPRADEVITAALKGISSQYHLYHYLLPVPHVLLGPTGFYLFRAYLHEGPIQYDGKRWKQKFSLLRSLGFSGQDALGDPIRDAGYDVQRFVSWLRKRLPAERVPQADGTRAKQVSPKQVLPLPPVTPLIVFVRDKAQLEIAPDASGEEGGARSDDLSRSGARSNDFSRSGVRSNDFSRSTEARLAIPVLTPRQLKREIRNLIKAQPEVLDEDALYHIERAMLGDKVDKL